MSIPHFYSFRSWKVEKLLEFIYARQGLSLLFKKMQKYVTGVFPPTDPLREKGEVYTLTGAHGVSYLLIICHTIICNRGCIKENFLISKG
jgi:hypothetical protein